jgi:hypothetical protein
MAQLITPDYDKLVPNLSLLGTGFEQGTRISESMANREALKAQAQASGQLAGIAQTQADQEMGIKQGVADDDRAAALDKRNADFQALMVSKSDEERAELDRENKELTTTAVNALGITDTTQRRLFLERKRAQYVENGRDTSNIDRALALDDAELEKTLTMQAEQGQELSVRLNRMFPNTETPTSLQKNLKAAGLVEGSEEFKDAVLAGTVSPSTNVTIGDAEVKSKLAQANLDLKNLQIKLNERKGNEFSDAQNKSAQFASIMVQAEENITLSLKSGYDPTTAGQAALGVVPGGNVLRSEDSQIHKQAQEAWVRGKLRRESGAVIAPDEMDQEIKTFFPVFGDKPEVIKQKKRARDNATKAISAAAGGALTAIEEAPVSRFVIEVVE